MAGIGEQRERVGAPAVVRLDDDERDVDRDADRKRPLDALRDIAVRMPVAVRVAVPVRMAVRVAVVVAVHGATVPRAGGQRASCARIAPITAR